MMINKNSKTEHENMRRQLWIETYVAVAGSSNCVDVMVPAHWAGKAVAAFDKSFPKDEADDE